MSVPLDASNTSGDEASRQPCMGCNFGWKMIFIFPERLVADF